MILTPFLSVIAEAGISWVKARSAERQSLSKARSQRVLMAAKTEASWAEYMAHASASGWKDEAWTLCFIAIIAACFIPATQPYVLQGFEMLDKTPPWFQWAVLASIGASFGLRGFDRFQRRHPPKMEARQKASEND